MALAQLGLLIRQSFTHQGEQKNGIRSAATYVEETSEEWQPMRPGDLEAGFGTNHGRPEQSSGQEQDEED